MTLGPQAKQEIHFRFEELNQLSSKYANDIQFKFFSLNGIFFWKRKSVKSDCSSSISERRDGNLSPEANYLAVGEPVSNKKRSS